MSDQDSRRTVPSLRDLTADELLDIRSILPDRAYNFAEPPDPQIEVSLSDYLANARFPFALADAGDKWGVNAISMDNFGRLFNPGQIGWPGYLSAISTAKLIAFCLQIAESTRESLPELHGISCPTAEDVMNQLADLARTSHALQALSPWKQFFVCTKNPVIRRAVNNAIMNRWGVSQTNGSEFD